MLEIENDNFYELNVKHLEDLEYRLLQQKKIAFAILVINIFKRYPNIIHIDGESSSQSFIILTEDNYKDINRQLIWELEDKLHFLGQELKNITLRHNNLSHVYRDKLDDWVINFLGHQLYSEMEKLSIAKDLSNTNQQQEVRKI